MANYYGTPAIVTDGLIFAVDAGNGQSYVNGSSTCTSLVGSITGDLINDVSGSMGNKNSWNFDGVDDYIETTSTASFLDGSQYFTINLWIEPLVADYTYILDLPGPDIYLFIRNTGAVDISQGTTSYFNRSNVDAVPVDSWTNVCCTYDGTQSRYSRWGLYVNGVSNIASNTGGRDSSMPSATGVLLIGQRSSGNGSFNLSKTVAIEAAAQI